MKKMHQVIDSKQYISGLLGISSDYKISEEIIYYLDNKRRERDVARAEILADWWNRRRKDKERREAKKKFFIRETIIEFLSEVE
jgi:hypothetical protein